MPETCMNIYGRYRRAAGLTQERAAELLGCAVRTIANWEGGVNTPPDAMVVRMADVYQAPTIAIEHLRATTMLARDILPIVKVVPLSQAVCGLVSAVRNFIESDCDWALLEIASDGAVDEMEEQEFKRLLEELDKIVKAAMVLRFSKEGTKWS